MNAIAFKTTIKGGKLDLEGAEGMIGKNVLVTIVELEENLGKKLNPRNWDFAGKAGFNGKLDHINIRDFAND